MRSESAKMKSLAELCSTLIKNTKRGVTNGTERNRLKRVVSDLLGRPATDADLNSISLA